MRRLFCIFSFSRCSRQRSSNTFCSAIITAEAPQQSSPPCIFHTPLLLLLGGLLGKAEASHLALRPLPTHSLAVKMFFSCFFGAPKSILLFFDSTVSGCDSGNRTRNIAVYTWRGALAH
jgi:hypothetical protein